MTQAEPQPQTRRWLHGDDPLSTVEHDGPFRILSFDGRRGVNPTSVHSRLCFDAPAINQPKGTLTLWVYFLEEVSTQGSPRHVQMLQPDSLAVPLLTDHREVREFNDATFAMTFVLNWYPHFFVKRCKGPIYPNAYGDHKTGIVGLGHWPVRREAWYHVSYTWDQAVSDYRVYLNGVLAGTSMQQDAHKPLRFETGGQTLYAGHPKVVLSDVRLHAEAMSQDEVRQEIADDATPIHSDVQDELERVYAGVGVPKLDWSPPADWETVTDLPLIGSGTLEEFYVQGNQDAPVETDEGIRVRTAFENTPKPADWDETHTDLDEPFDVDQVYLWLERFFEGDIYLTYEFKSRSNLGLSLLCAQASGMHGEDFMADHPRRVSGAMRMVFAENVRLYHWEYYRHMGDCRNDVASSGLIKQPWQWPLAYQCFDHTLALDVWHRLEFLHVGERLVGALNGLIVFDVVDNPHTNNGPVFRRGRFGIRCMRWTDMTFRGLKVSQPSNTLGVDAP